MLKWRFFPFRKNCHKWIMDSRFFTMVVQNTTRNSNSEV